MFLRNSETYNPDRSKIDRHRIIYLSRDAAFIYLNVWLMGRVLTTRKSSKNVCNINAYADTLHCCQSFARADKSMRDLIVHASDTCIWHWFFVV